MGVAIGAATKDIDAMFRDAHIQKLAAVNGGQDAARQVRRGRFGRQALQQPGGARLAGCLRAAGAALHACDDPSVPWHRVVRADGSLAMGDRQRTLLEREGVPFRGARVDLRVARCAPDVAPA